MKLGIKACSSDGSLGRLPARLALTLDDDSAPRVFAQLRTDLRSLLLQNGIDQLSIRNAITLTITLASE
ncbi:hypothetical protein ACFWVC_38335 [Streptomyces sp. NPDC058691]|uniref:hypothetical protein n=1 Tax=Streptomyces sp. NPDC058691 TaxID=3346601 RepID=UPI00365F4614